jgi:glutathione synthase/RimK-type ligase-like ATP-grasp enzyme
MKLGVVYGYRKGRWIKHSTDSLLSKFREALAPRGVEVEKIGLLDSRVEIRKNHLVVRNARTKKRYDDIDGIHIANWRKAPETAMALARYIEKRGGKVMNGEIISFPAMTKLGEMVRMADKNIPLPDSFFVRDKYLVEMAKRQKLPHGFHFPLIVKSVAGSMGTNNWLVHDFNEFAEIVSLPREQMVVVQNFVPNDCDYRVLIFGGKVRAVIRRSRQSDDTHVNNTSAGGRGDMVLLDEFPEEWKDISLRAAEATNRLDIAGVDIIPDSVTGKPYVLEVNKTPQIETGSNTDKKTDIFIDYIIGKLQS